MIYSIRRSIKFGALLGILLTLTVTNSFAIDNPDAPNYLGDFQNKAERFEHAINETSNAKAAAEARGSYEKFLDSELNSTYKLLHSKLAATQKNQLQESQRAWLKYLDSESIFINANWTPDNFGSSSAISRHMYRMTIIRNRVEQLIGYLANY